MLWTIVFVLSNMIGILLAIYIPHVIKNKEKPIVFLRKDIELIKKHHAHFIDFPVERVLLIMCCIQLLSLLIYAINSSSFTAFFALGSSAILVVFCAQALVRFFIKQKFVSRFWTVGFSLSIISLVALAYIFPFSFAWVAAEQKQLLIIFHILGTMIGAGGATYADIFFFKFLKDLKITQEESSMLKSISEIIWVGLALLILSGLGFYLPAFAKLNTTQKFLAKMIIVAIIFVNGLLLNAYISPRIQEISFDKKSPENLSTFKKIAFASGAISLTSWYFAVILGALRTDVAVVWWVVFGIYLAVVSVAIICSQIFGMSLVKKAHR